jgi:hypothetical protein
MTGGTLADKLRNEGPLPYRLAVDFALQIAEGLEAAARAGVIHRDVKPSNCFVDGSGAVRVGDFGLSKTLEVDAHLTATGSFLGTPSYSSPEQVRGRDVDFRTDLYSLGATLYALLTGRPPFSGSGTEVLARILSEPPEPFSSREASVPRGLQQIVERLLAKDKARRYSSYGALRDALLPYSSRGLAAGDVGRRAVAILADLVVVNLAIALLGGSRLLFQPTVLNQVAHDLLQLVYFHAARGALGPELGKRLFGLRVVTSSAGPASFLSVLAAPRSSSSVLSLADAVDRLPVPARLPGHVQQVTVSARLVGPPGADCLIELDDAPSHGYAALHDLDHANAGHGGACGAEPALSRARWTTIGRPSHTRAASDPTVSCIPSGTGGARACWWPAMTSCKGQSGSIATPTSRKARPLTARCRSPRPAAVATGPCRHRQVDAYEAPSGIAFPNGSGPRGPELGRAAAYSARRSNRAGLSGCRGARHGSPANLAGLGSRATAAPSSSTSARRQPMDGPPPRTARELIQQLLVCGLEGTAVRPTERSGRPPGFPCRSMPNPGRALLRDRRAVASAAELRDALELVRAGGSRSHALDAPPVRR